MTGSSSTASWPILPRAAKCQGHSQTHPLPPPRQPWGKEGRQGPSTGKERPAHRQSPHRPTGDPHTQDPQTLPFRNSHTHVLPSTPRCRPHPQRHTQIHTGTHLQSHTAPLWEGRSREHVTQESTWCTHAASRTSSTLSRETPCWTSPARPAGRAQRGPQGCGPLTPRARGASGYPGLGP